MTKARYNLEALHGNIAVIDLEGGAELKICAFSTAKANTAKVMSTETETIMLKSVSCEALLSQQTSQSHAIVS